jgi:peptide-methionine (S)-S-oxide reductase
VLAKQVDITASGKREAVTFAGGCFWGIELAFQRVPGVCLTEVGYCNGNKKNPTYEEVCTGLTGHAEAVKVVFDTSAIKFEDLLTVFWDLIDPTQLNQQGNDVGTQYRTGIYYQTEDQKSYGSAIEKLNSGKIFKSSCNRDSSSILLVSC